MDDRSRSARPAPFLFSLIHRQFQEVELLLGISEALKGFNKESAERMDAMYGYGRRPKRGGMGGWTPVVELRGGSVASKVEEEMELDATYGCDRRPKWGRLE